MIINMPFDTDASVKDEGQTGVGGGLIAGIRFQQNTTCYIHRDRLLTVLPVN